MLAAVMLALGCEDEPAYAPRDNGRDEDGDEASSGRNSDPAQPRAGRGGSTSARRDAGPFTPPEVNPPDPESGEPFLLSQTGLYADFEAKELAPDLLAFEPSFALWADGADKKRWLRLPKGERIDSSDMDHWQFPVGAMLFKEFSLHGKRLETRLIMRTGEGERDYWMGAFVWDDDDAEARFVPDGAKDVRGTAHDVPTVKNCFTCHDGDAGRVLGFSAVQLPDVPLAVLSDPPLHTFVPPGDAIASAALGYLHANCAHCHNPQGSARPDTDMNTRLGFDDRRLVETQTFITLVGVPLQYFDSEPLSLRIAPGNPAESGVVFRMMERGPKTQMPPIASELADEDGIAAVSAWIERL